MLRTAPTHAGALGLLGILRLTAGHADEAGALLEQALKGKPREAMLLGALGLARLMQGNAGAAEESLRSALKWGERDDPMVRMRLGMALSAQGRAAEATNELRRALALSPGNPDVMLNLANALADSGQSKQAEDQLRQVIARWPNHGDARFNLGTLLMRLERLDEAASEFTTLLTYYPTHADVHNNLGIVYERQAKLEEAAQAYRKALELDAGHLSALNNLGNVLRAQGQGEEAARYYAQAMERSPGHADGYLNMGMLRAEQGRLEEARGLFEKALSVDPLCSEAAINLAEIFRQAGAFAESVDAFHKALAVDSGNVVALNGMGNIFRMQGQWDAAADCYVKATRAVPGDANGFLNLGVLRAQQGRIDEACTLLEQAVAVDPRSAPAQLKLAEVLRASGKLDEAADAYRRLLALQPDNAAGRAGLAHVRQHQCDWQGIEALWDEVRAALREEKDAGVTPFSALSIPTTPQEQLACARAWARREFGWVGNQRQSIRRPEFVSRPESAIRLGYLSWDYHQHATAYLMAEVFELHDRAHFSVHAYSFGPDDGSAIRQRIRGACDSFSDIASLSDAAAAQRIADDGIDILIDLKGYTLGARTAIMAYRPAPVAVNWLGFPGTMGTDCIDWIIADRFIVPEGAEAGYQEKVYRLPDCYQPNDRQRAIADPPTRTECGLPENGVVLCCFNQSYKILPEMFAAWMRILSRVPGSVLWLLETNPWARKNLQSSAVAQGVSADRIVFAPHRPLAEHLSRYRIADLALDTFPYTSHTTASDALWAGCPLVALAGNTFASRVSGSVLNAAGMPELATTTVEAFEDLAVKLAFAPERRAELRHDLQQGQMNLALFDTPRFVRNLEHAYRSFKPDAVS